MFFRHPSKRALQQWLDNAEESKIDSHLDTCQRCAAVIEGLDVSDDLSLGDALAAVYELPPDLSDRLERRVAARLDSRVVLDVVSDLFGAGLETSKLLLTEDPVDE
ncbi:MAG: anti-sigma factor family protein [Acidimicrobiales bacterium]